MFAHCKNEILIFMHIPKTAGTSLHKAICSSLKKEQYLELYGIRKTSKEIEAEILNLSQEDRRKIKYIGGHQVWYGIHRLFEQRAKYIVFLRDPVARVISDYFKILRTETNGYHDEVVGNNLSFDEFLKKDVSPYVRNHMTVFLGRDYVDDCHNGSMCGKVDSEFLDVALKNLEQFYFVGITERYREDIKLLSDMLGMHVKEEKIHAPSIDVKKEKLAISNEVLKLCSAYNEFDQILFHKAVLINESLR